MKFIGITGGVGAGKSEILHFLREHYRATVVLADDVAKDLMKPGSPYWSQVVEALQVEESQILCEDGTMNRVVMAQVMFADEKKRLAVNAVVHPAVKDTVLQMVEQQKRDGDKQYFFLEAALLIEDHYDEICDELWYIHTDQQIRRDRLKASRGYTDEKIDQILARQLPEETFREKCKVVIDNSGDLQESFAQIEEVLDKK